MGAVVEIWFEYLNPFLLKDSHIVHCSFLVDLILGIRRSGENHSQTPRISSRERRELMFSQNREFHLGRGEKCFNVVQQCPSKAFKMPPVITSPPPLTGALSPHFT